MEKKTGWRVMPLSLKIVGVLTGLWVLGSIMAVASRYAAGLPFFGVYLYGVAASIVVITLDILGPVAFLVGLWKRKAWAPVVAASYMGVFILNSLVALVTIREQVGAMPILIPAFVNLVLILVIFKKKAYFN